MSENQNNIKDKSNSKKYFSIIPNIIREMDLDSFAISAYFILLSYANDGGACFPSNKTVASKMKCNVDTYLKARKLLETKRLIKVIIRKKGNGSFDTTLIEILDIWGKNINFFNNRGSQPDRGGVVHQIEEGSPPDRHEEEPSNKKEIVKESPVPKKALKKKNSKSNASVVKTPLLTTKVFYSIKDRLLTNLQQKDIDKLKAKFPTVNIDNELCRLVQ